MKHSAAEIIREYGPFPDVDDVAGVSFDGYQVWFATGEKLNALDPESGEILRSFGVAAHAGTAFDGEHLFQIGDAVIRKIDPKTGEVDRHNPSAGGWR
jgi:hypothetical protein